MYRQLKLSLAILLGLLPGAGLFGAPPSDLNEITGFDKDASLVIEDTSGDVGHTTLHKLRQLKAQDESDSDTSNSNRSSVTIDPVENRVNLTVNDSDGTDITMGETNADDGDWVILQNVSDNMAYLAESSGVVEITGTDEIPIGPEMSVTLIYESDRWKTVSDWGGPVNFDWFPALQEAVAGGSDGDVLLIPRVLDLANFGTLNLTDELRNIQGLGWSSDNSRVVGGSALLNTGADAVANPVIDKNVGAGNLGSGLRLEDFAIDTDQSGYAIEIENNVRNHIQNLWIECRGAADGIRLGPTDAFFSRLENVNIKRFLNTGIRINTNGSEIDLKSMDVGSNVGATGAAALRIEARGVHVWGGEFKADTSDGSGHGILIDRTTGTIPNNIRIEGVLFEDSDTAIEITNSFDSTSFGGQNVVIEQPRIPLDATVNGSDLGIRFEDAVDCQLRNPYIRSSGQTLAEWGGNSVRCGVVAKAQSIGTELNNGRFTVDAGADAPYIRLTGVTDYSFWSSISFIDSLVYKVDYMERLGPIVNSSGGWTKGLETGLSDDGVVSFTAPSNLDQGVYGNNASGILEISDGSDSATIHYDMGSTTAIQAQTGSVFNAGLSGSLAGTTSTDGNINVSVDSSNVIYVENRSAGPVNVTWSFTEWR